MVAGENDPLLGEDHQVRAARLLRDGEAILAESRKLLAELDAATPDDAS